MHLACGAVAKLAGRLNEAINHYDVAMPVIQQLDDAIGQANIFLTLLPRAVAWTSLTMTTASAQPGTRIGPVLTPDRPSDALNAPGVPAVSAPI